MSQEPVKDSSESGVPRIEYPCDYPIKVIGDASAMVREEVFAVVSRHVPEFVESEVVAVDSRNARFVSLRFSMRATGEPHIRALFEDLKGVPGVQMVL